MWWEYFWLACNWWGESYLVLLHKACLINWQKFAFWFELPCYFHFDCDMFSCYLAYSLITNIFVSNLCTYCIQYDCHHLFLYLAFSPQVVIHHGIVLLCASKYQSVFGLFLHLGLVMETFSMKIILIEIAHNGFQIWAKMAKKHYLAKYLAIYYSSQNI